MVLLGLVREEFLPPNRLAKKAAQRNESPAHLEILNRNPHGSAPLLRRRGGQHVNTNKQRKTLPAWDVQSSGTVQGGLQEESRRSQRTNDSLLKNSLFQTSGQAAA